MLARMYAGVSVEKPESTRFRRKHQAFFFKVSAIEIMARSLDMIMDRAEASRLSGSFLLSWHDLSPFTYIKTLSFTMLPPCPLPNPIVPRRVSHNISGLI